MSFETNLEIKQLKQGLLVWTITLRQSESGRSCLNCLKAQLTCGLNQNSSAILLNTWSWWGQRALRVTLLIHVKKLTRVPELQQNPRQSTSSHLLQCFWKMFSKNKTELCRMAQRDCLRGSHTSLKPILVSCGIYVLLSVNHHKNHLNPCTEKTWRQCYLSLLSSVGSDKARRSPALNTRIAMP